MLLDNHSQWTHRQLSTAVSRVRAELTNAAVTADDAVLVLAPLRNAAVAAYLAVLDLGAVVVLLDRRCGESDLLNACRAARPRVALAFEADSQRLDLARHCRVLPLDRVEGHGAPIADDSDTVLDPDVPAVVVFTSGTTSAPKGVIHTLNSLRCATANMVAALEVTSDDAFFLSSPLASITGVLQLESALAVHGKLILEDRFSAGSSLDRVCRYGATIIGGAPVIAESLFAEADRRGLHALPLRCVAVGGAMVPQTVADTAIRFGVRPVRVYGSSEAPYSTSTALTDGSAVDDGVALSGVEVATRDGDELVISGPHQFHGYLDAADNADSFSDDWFRTGDQADIVNGRVRITGRLKEVVIRKGMKISLAEVDTAAAVLGECAAFGMPDEMCGERVALAVRGERGDHLRQRGRTVVGGRARQVESCRSRSSCGTGRFRGTPAARSCVRSWRSPARRYRSVYAPRLNARSSARP